MSNIQVVGLLSEIREVMRGNVLVLTVCSSLWRMSSDVVWTYLSLYIIDLGGEYETIGQVMALGNLASMALYPVGGYIADYQGRIKIMAYMTYAYAFTFLIFVFTRSWVWVAVGVFAQNLATFYIPAMQALMADSIPADKRGVGFAATMAIPGAFGVASPLLGGWLIDRYGVGRAVRGLYAAGFVVALVVATLRLKFLRETVERRGEGIRFTVGGVPRLLATAYRDVYRTLRAAPRRLLRVSLLMSGCAFVVSLVSPFWVVAATEVIGLNTTQWGTISFINGGINVLLGIPAGRYVDRHSKRRVAGVCLMAMAVPVLLFLRASSFTHVVLLMVTATLFNTFLNPAFQSLFVDLTPPDQRGRLISALGAAGLWVTGGAWGTGIVAMVSITLGTLLSGYVYRFSHAAPWVVLSVSLVALGAMFLLMVDEPEQPVTTFDQ